MKITRTPLIALIVLAMSACVVDAEEELPPDTDALEEMETHADPQSAEGDCIASCGASRDCIMDCLDPPKPDAKPPCSQ